MLLGIVHDGALELGREDVAHHAHRQIGLLEHHRRCLGLLDALLEYVVELLQVQQLAFEVLALGAVGGGPHDRPAAAEVELRDLLAQTVALLVLQAPRHADALARRGEDEVAARDGQLHREPGPLRLQRVLDDLDHDLLAGLEQVGDASAPAAAAAALGRLDARQHDLVDVQEAVLLEADVDEGGLQARQDVVDLALVYVADDRAIAASLYVELSDAIAGLRRAAGALARTCFRRLPRFARGRG